MSTHLPAELDRRSSAVVAAFGAPTTADAAQLLVAAGVPVFPCVPRTKRPLTRHGFHDATVDPTEVARIWQRRPEANLAIPTGRASGFDVVDVDVHGGESGRPAFDRSLARGLTTGWAFTVRTPSGGLHAYYPSSEAGQSSWQVPSVHVDFRGDGGYVVVPPSRVEYDDGSSGSYRLGVVASHRPTRVNGTALRAFIEPPHRVPAYARAASAVLGADPDRLAAWVAQQGEESHNRHHALFWASCRMVEAGFDVHSTLGALVPASVSTGYPEREAVTTVQSAFRHTRPQDPEFRRAREHAARPARSGRSTSSTAPDGGRRPEPPEVVTL